MSLQLSQSQSNITIIEVLFFPVDPSVEFNPLASEKIRTDSRIREIQALTPFNSTIKNKSIYRHKIPKICPVYRLKPKN